MLYLPKVFDASVPINSASLYFLALLQIPINTGLKQNTSSYSPLPGCLLQHLSEVRETTALVSTSILTTQPVISPFP